MTETGDMVFLTGASGFVGSHVLRTLLAAQYRVRALVRPNSRPLPPLEGCTTVVGDVVRSGELVQHMVGCRYLVHVAALYSFSLAIPMRPVVHWAARASGRQKLSNRQRRGRA